MAIFNIKLLVYQRVAPFGSVGPSTQKPGLFLSGVRGELALTQSVPGPE